ncbi:MAG TPA: GAF domain-containing protein [Terriglobales bacterium]|nr:GAF domain-containing protein [Terriglobales bacterium]
MVLPVRMWGTDSAGKSFNVLAYTLDISSSGARLGGVRVPLAVGEAVTLQYKQQRALFKVAWVGRPGEKTHEQVGIYALEPDKHIWLEIPEPPQFVDDFEPKGKPAKPAVTTQPAPPPVSKAAPATPAPSTPAASAAPKPAAPATAASAIGSDDVSALLRACANDLLRIDELVKQNPTDGAVLHDFREALSKVRQTTWALQQWQELNQESEQPFPLLWFVNSERLRFVVQAVQDLWTDVADKGVEIDETLLEPLFATIERMRLRYPGGAPPPDAIDLTDESHRALSGEHPQDTAASRLVQQVSAMQRDLERAHPDVDSALHFIADSMLHILGADGLTIAVADQGEMVCTASVGVAPEVGMVVDTESGLGAEAVASRQFVYCRDTQGDPRVDAESCAAANIGSVLMLPVNSDLGIPVAMFEISSARKNAFADEHLLALKAAAAIVQSLLATEGVRS